ncbi:MAG: glycosyltransferase family 39 protein, partial [Deltaproteobacteria bacterium]|nr:glycosyltransferase family 39 protein [Deltaproteobacteria bacterium]
MLNYLQIFTWIKKKENVIFLFLITALGFFLRIYRLDYPCLWYDELCTFFRLNGDMAHTLGTLKISPFPPLYYILMNIWCKIFGFSEFSLRFPSMLFSTLSVISIYFLAKHLFSERVGMISALLLSVSTHSINYAHDAKMYAITWFLCIISFIYFFKFVNNPNRKTLVLYGIFSCTTIYTMYLGFLFLIVQNILFFSLYRGKLKPWITTNILILLSYIPWCYYAIYNMANASGIDWIKSTNYSKFFQRFFQYISGIGIGDSVPGESWLLIFLVVMAFIFSIYMVIKKNKTSASKTILP